MAEMKTPQGSDINQRAAAERDRLMGILDEAEVSDRRMKTLAPVVENTAWMKVKLDDSRAAIKNAQVAITYNNGGGQTGLRENPLFKGYESLWKSYMSGMTAILAALPAEIARVVEEEPQESAPQNVLSMIRSRHKRDA